MQLPAATLLVNLTEFLQNIGLKDFLENYDNHAKFKNELVEFQSSREFSKINREPNL